MDKTLTDNQNSNYQSSGTGEPDAVLSGTEVLDAGSSGLEIPDAIPTGSDVVDLTLKLKAAIDDFRKAVEEAVDQRRQSGLQKSVCNTSGKPTLRKFPVRIREPAWVTSREAISILKVSLRTLRRYRKQQLFTCKTVNGAYRYRYIDLVELMKSKASNV